MLLLMGLLGIAMAASPQAGTLVDGVAAVVNGHAITRSEAEERAAFARVAAGLETRAAAPTANSAITPAELAEAVRHLVDERLLLEARAEEGYAWAPDSEVERQWQRWQTLAGGAAALEARLAPWRLDDATVRNILRNQLTILDMLDLRLGATVSVSEADVATYYHGELHGTGPTPAALHDSIVEILRQRKLSDAGEQWIGELRQAARIEVRPPPT